MVKIKEKCSYIRGARNLIKSLDLMNERSLIILSSEDNKEFSNYILEAAKQEEINNVVYIIIPKIFRPITKIPALLVNAIKKARALIIITNRLAEESFAFYRPLETLCIDNKCKYIYIFDGKMQYLKEGIAADYMEVYKKVNSIKNILKDSKEITVTSKLGTNLTFSLYTHKIVARSPIFTEGTYSNQSPEGETMTCPLEKTFNGRMVIDGVVTGLGPVPKPITWHFEDGVVTKVEGEKEFLSSLLTMLQRSDKRLKSLVGIWIAELSIGANDWAVFDDNISNCEKVSGGVHFAMGRTAGGIGVKRGENFHFDNIMKTPTLVVTQKNGKKLTLIEQGKLMV